MVFIDFLTKPINLQTPKQQSCIIIIAINLHLISANSKKLC